jgi:hypothetical protein
VPAFDARRQLVEDGGGLHEHHRPEALGDCRAQHRRCGGSTIVLLSGWRGSGRAACVAHLHRETVELGALFDRVEDPVRLATATGPRL